MTIGQALDLLATGLVCACAVTASVVFLYDDQTMSLYVAVGITFVAAVRLFNFKVDEKDE